MIEIVVNNEYKLDLFSNTEDNSVLLNFVVQDIRNIGQTNSSFSKTIKFPGSKNNNMFFKNIFDVNVDSEFDPRKKADVQVYSDGTLIFNGILKLDTIDVNKDYFITYNCTLFSTITDLYTELGNKLLNQLDLSEYNHNYTLENVVDSWDSYIIKYGGRIPFNKGDGYVYPYIDYGNNSILDVNERKLEFFRPAFYAKTIVDKIFSSVEYTYESNFFNSDYFKSLIVVPPLIGSYFDGATLENSKARADLSATTSTAIINFIYGNDAPTPTIVPFNNDFNDGNYDNGDNFNLTTHKYIAPNSGLYTINTTVNLFNAFGDLSSPIGSVVSYIIAGDITYKVDIIRKRNGVETVLDSNNFTFNLNSAIVINYANFPSRQIVVSVEDELLIGDEVYVKAGYTLKDTYLYTVLGQQVGCGTIFSKGINSFLQVDLNNQPIGEGSLYNMNNLLTNDLCSDFIKSLTKMFNLVFEPSTIDNKKIIIEPRDDFYSDTVIDWTYKHDRLNDAIITPVSEIKDGNILFTYTDDNDYYNNKYKTNTKETYGQYLYKTESDFVDINSQTEIKPIFAPTPLVDEFVESELTERYVSTIYSRNTTNENTIYNQSKLRILYFDGVLPTNELVIDSRINNTGYTYNYYPYAGHIDNPEQPTEDLNYYFVKEYYFKRANLTNSTLFNKYWRGFIRDFYSKDSKMFSGYFRLTDDDIFNFSFRNIIYFDRQYWIVNKIFDYDVNKDGLTRVELLSINDYKKANNFVYPDEQFINIGDNEFFIGGNGKDDSVGIVNLPDRIKLSNDISGFDNTFGNISVFNNIIKGNSNKISSNVNSLSLFGNQNFVGGNTSLSTLFGNYNNFEFGLNKTIVLGDNNQSNYKLTNSTLNGNNNELFYSDKLTLFGSNNTLSAISDSIIIANNSNISNLSGVTYIKNIIVDGISGLTNNIYDKTILYNNNGQIYGTIKLGYDYDIQYLNLGTNQFADSGTSYTISLASNVSNLSGTSEYSAIIASENAIIKDSKNSAIIAGKNLTLDNEDNTLSTSNLKVKDSIKTYDGANYVSGFTGNIPFTATSISVVNGIIVGYI